MKRTILLMLLFAGLQLVAQTQQADPADAYHHFDFWLGRHGEWIGAADLECKPGWRLSLEGSF